MTSFKGCHNGCNLAYIGNTSNLDINHCGSHCINFPYLECACFSITDSIQINGLTCVFNLNFKNMWPFLATFSSNKYSNLRWILPIWHEFKLSIRGNKWDRSVILESWQSYTLVKLHILQFNTFTLSSAWKRPNWLILKRLTNRTKTTKWKLSHYY